MKKTLVISTFLLAGVALACPNFSGKYSCYDNETGYYMDMDISQTGSGKNTVFTVTNAYETNTSRADGIWRITNDVDFTGEERVYCKESSVIFEMKGSSPYDGSFSIRTESKLLANGDLESTAVMTAGGQTYPADISVCSKR